MDLFKSFVLLESQKAAIAELNNSIDVINKVYNEWKKIHRRVNSVDLITTSVNKILKISPNTIEKIHATGRLKLATIIMRCMDLPPWKDPETKKTIYKKLFNIIKKVENDSPNTGSGGTLREIIMTRLSACFYEKSKNKVFVAYEPVISKNYQTYLFHTNLPKQTYKMTALPLPEDFDSLLDILKMNQEKAEKAYSKVNNQK